MKSDKQYLEYLNSVYQDSNYYDIFFLKSKLDLTNLKILDYWSWNWKLFEYLIEHKWVQKELLYWVDIEQSHLDYIKDNLWINNLSLVNLNNQKTIYNDWFFDIVFCLDIIEHSEKPDNIMNELKRILKPNWIIILCTPNRFTRFINKKLFWTFKMSNWYNIFIFNIKRVFWKAFLDSTHVMEYLPWQFKNLLKKHNLVPIKSNFTWSWYIPLLSTSSFIVHLIKKENDI